MKQLRVLESSSTAYACTSEVYVSFGWWRCCLSRHASSMPSIMIVAFRVTVMRSKSISIRKKQRSGRLNKWSEALESLFRQRSPIRMYGEGHCLTTMFTSVFHMHIAKKPLHFITVSVLLVIKHGVTISTWQHVRTESNWRRSFLKHRAKSNISLVEVGKDKFHLTHQFDKYNGVSMPTGAKLGVGGAPLAGEDLRPKNSVYPRGTRERCILPTVRTRSLR